MEVAIQGCLKVRRRHCDNLTTREVDYYYYYYYYRRRFFVAELDTNKHFGDFRTGQDSPDKMPSVNFVEGNLNANLKRFVSLDVVSSIVLKCVSAY